MHANASDESGKFSVEEVRADETGLRAPKNTGTYT